MNSQEVSTDIQITDQEREALEARLAHFIENAWARTRVALSIEDCLEIENLLRQGKGNYIRSSAKSAPGREVREIRYKKRKLTVVYQRADYGLITCLKYGWNLTGKKSENTLESNRNIS